MKLAVFRNINTKLLILCACILVILFITAKAWFWWDALETDLEWHHEVALAKKEGLLVDSELDAWPKVPPDQDAAPIYNKYSEIDPGYGKAPSYVPQKGASDQQNLVNQGKYFQEMSSQLDLIRLASRKPSMSYTIASSRGNTFLEPPHSYYSVYSFLNNYAEYEIEMHQLDSAYKDIVALAKIGFQGNDASYPAPKTLVTLLNQAPEFAQKAQKELRLGQPDNSRLIPRLKAALYSCFHTFDHSLPGQDEVCRTGPDGECNEYRKSNDSTTRKRWQIEVIRYYRKLFQAALSGNDASQLLQLSRQLVSNSHKDPRLALPTVYWDSSSAIGSEALYEAYGRVYAQALAIISSGKIPNALPLGGDVSRDPQSGYFLHYRHNAKGFIIYANGAGGEDHGGIQNGPGNDLDVVFRYHWPVETPQGW